jgi:hypothetical protein
MSRKINVNPGQYKVAGRERQGEEVVHERQKQLMGQDRARLASAKKARTGSAKAGPADGREDGEPE